MKHPCYTLVFFLFICLSSNAQFFDNSYYSKGFLITNDKDTIHGYIEAEDGYNGTIKYKINKDDKKSLKMESSTIQYVMVGYDSFEKVRYENYNILMQIIVKGEISLYKNIEKRSRVTSGGMGMGQAPTMTTQIIEVYYLVKNDQTIKIKKRKLHTTLKELMIDCQELYPEIDKLDTDYDMLRFNLKDLLVQYNYKIKDKLEQNKNMN